MSHNYVPDTGKVSCVPTMKDLDARALFEDIPVAIYTCDLHGFITFYNYAAVKLWGREPERGDKFCGSWKLFTANGTPLPHDACPMAKTLQHGLRLTGDELLVIERPNGTRSNARTFPVPLFDADGQLCGAINSLLKVSIPATDAEDKQALLASIINTSDDAIISKNLNGLITTWNLAAERMFGYKPEEVIGKHIGILIPPERIEEEAVIISNIISGQKVDHFETIRLTKDGRRIPISLSVSPIVDLSGKIIGASKIARDITERNIAGEKQSILSAIIESSDNAIISRDLNGNISSWNPAAERMFGFTQTEIIGRHISTLIPADLLGEEDKIFRDVNQGKKIDHLETRRLTKDGRELTVSLTVSPIVNLRGEVVGASKIARDITGWKIAEEKQANLAAIVKSSDDAIISKTLAGIITSWNTSAENLFGYSAAEILGKHISILIPADRIDEENVIIGHIARGEKVDHFETIRVARDGHEIPLSITVSPLINSRGEIIGASKIARDISAQQKAQAVNDALFQEIKALNEKKDEFIGIASHELKTPLTSISGYLQLLAKFQGDETTRKFIDKTIHQVNKLTSLVSDMLDVSKIEAGKLQFSKKKFDIKLMVENAIELIRYTHTGPEISLTTDNNSIPFYGDEQRIEQVMINLLSNAIKYSPPDTKINVSLSLSEKEILVGVKDEGFGVAPALQNKIFTRFYRVEDVNPNTSGLGIGLYISSQVIERHEGRIWVESELGKGSTFWFVLPRPRKHI